MPRAALLVKRREGIDGYELDLSHHVKEKLLIQKKLAPTQFKKQQTKNEAVVL